MVTTSWLGVPPGYDAVVSLTMDGHSVSWPVMTPERDRWRASCMRLVYRGIMSYAHGQGTEFFGVIPVEDELNYCFHCHKG